MENYIPGNRNLSSLFIFSQGKIIVVLLIRTFSNVVAPKGAVCFVVRQVV